MTVDDLPARPVRRVPATPVALFRDQRATSTPLSSSAWEPTVRVPEGASDFSWLYRPAAPVEAPPVPAAVPLTPVPVSVPAVEAVPAGPATPETAAAGWAGPARRRRRWPAAALVLGAVSAASLLWGWTTGLL